ncbi:unnamed protein product [Caenorhabditis angaria]|uniref:Uncharacterized protein n=1 Tax=Caenorhabditis angaria TaxID=860376 RepID=A0A9P1J351_9PELO|nr:unnamed protein product [Caenorhabditis angaria]
MVLPTTSTFFFAIFLFFGVMGSEKQEQTVYDDFLIGIQNAVINNNQTAFLQYYTQDFDAAAWYKRFYQPFKPEERKTFIVRRFGEVQENTEGVKLSYSESYNQNGNSSDIHLISYDVVLKKVTNNTIGYGINDIKQHKT